MEFQAQIKQLNERIKSLKESTQTEEATKSAFVLPFIQALGYDVFNPNEVIPEYTCDVGTKKGEKVDYAIQQNGEPIIIVECKHWNDKLTLHDTQLQRYFHVTNARFAILTNGIRYKFYSDLEDQNKMDTKPFFEFDFENMKDSAINELLKFHKSTFDVDKILTNASFLKYVREIKELFEKEFNEPSEDFVKYFAKRVYDGKMTKKALDEFTTITERALRTSINDMVNNRLKAALEKEMDQQDEEQSQAEEENEGKKIVTTVEEIEGYHIVRALLRKEIDPERIVHRDQQTYFGILLDDNNRKPICRLHFNGSQKYLGLFDNDKNENKQAIDSLDEIYNYADELKQAALMYDN